MRARWGNSTAVWGPDPAYVQRGSLCRSVMSPCAQVCREVSTSRRNSLQRTRGDFLVPSLVLSLYGGLLFRL